MLTDVSPAQLRDILSQQEPAFVYLHTPLCGTCQLARRMLTIACTALAESGKDRPVYACDLNGLAAEAQAWQITSVPCLVRFVGGRPQETMYAFESVPKVYAFLAQPG